jgi:AraC family cel operon transcriptional repressor
MQRLIFASLRPPQPHFHCAWTHVGAGERTFGHTHDFPELFLVTSGAGRHAVNGGVQDLAGGDLVWMEAADRHCFEGLAPDGLRFINLALQPAWWSGFRSLFSPPCDPATRRAGGEPEIRSLQADEFKRVETALKALLTGGAVDDWWLMAALREAIPVFMREHRAGTDAAPQWLKSLSGLMRDPELAARPISWWQAKASCSKAHLARCCRKHYGRTLTDLLVEARMAQAEARLLIGRETVAAIAAEVGFENLGHFHAVFKRRTGWTPIEWRRRQANAIVPR